ncbi:hypothetical protein CXG81DRAFT_17731 [Caulochytrium protostelioides]|uniref:LAG1-DNAbind-domain-containing protein n=1 Tax=Caulochytrium protostelioides TaxID=1555241 RepID=A0A4P9XB49_9FUNG|nr:hypothetical protein CXG81DRAFT_17731 [Caulochytrium protostelioides]|eukprot:RKP02592.1 hypothetical protein CXG81DRAFT_17731 [Caulochytrium protostelioides]
MDEANSILSEVYPFMGTDYTHALWPDLFKLSVASAGPSSAAVAAPYEIYPPSPSSNIAATAAAARDFLLMSEMHPNDHALFSEPSLAPSLALTGPTDVLASCGSMGALTGAAPTDFLSQSSTALHNMPSLLSLTSMSSLPFPAYTPIISPHVPHGMLSHGTLSQGTHSQGTLSQGTLSAHSTSTGMGAGMSAGLSNKVRTSMSANGQATSFYTDVMGMDSSPLQDLFVLPTTPSLSPMITTSPMCLPLSGIGPLDRGGPASGHRTRLATPHSLTIATSSAAIATIAADCSASSHELRQFLASLETERDVAMGSATGVAGTPLVSPDHVASLGCLGSGGSGGGDGAACSTPTMLPPPSLPAAASTPPASVKRGSAHANTVTSNAIGSSSTSVAHANAATPPARRLRRTVSATGCSTTAYAAATSGYVKARRDSSGIVSPDSPYSLPRRPSVRVHAHVQAHAYAQAQAHAAAHPSLVAASATAALAALTRSTALGRPGVRVPDIVLFDPQQLQCNTIALQYGRLIQKSYGHEKRFLCPPPLLSLRGAIWRLDRSYPERGPDPLALARGESMFTPPMLQCNAETAPSDPATAALPDAWGAGFTRAGVQASLQIVPTQEPPSASLAAAAAATGGAAAITQQPSPRRAFAMDAGVLPDAGAAACAAPVCDDETPVHGDPTIDASELLCDPTSAFTCVFKEMYRQDRPVAEKKVRLRLDMTVQPLCAVSLSVTTAPLSVISKPAKARRQCHVGENSLLSGDTVAFFNRVRSQTVSTRFLGIDARTGALVPTTTAWQSFRIVKMGCDDAAAGSNAAAAAAGATAKAVTAADGTKRSFEDVICYNDHIRLIHVETGRIAGPFRLHKLTGAAPPKPPKKPKARTTTVSAAAAATTTAASSDTAVPGPPSPPGPEPVVQLQRVGLAPLDHPDGLLGFPDVPPSHQGARGSLAVVPSPAAYGVPASPTSPRPKTPPELMTSATPATAATATSTSGPTSTSTPRWRAPALGQGVDWCVVAITHKTWDVHALPGVGLSHMGRLAVPEIESLTRLDAGRGASELVGVGAEMTGRGLGAGSDSPGFLLAGRHLRPGMRVCVGGRAVPCHYDAALQGLVFAPWSDACSGLAEVMPTTAESSSSSNSAAAAAAAEGRVEGGAAAEMHDGLMGVQVFSAEEAMRRLSVASGESHVPGARGHGASARSSHALTLYEDPGLVFETGYVVMR